MRKSALVLLTGLCLSAGAGTVKGRYCGSSSAGGTLTICCDGKEGTCATVVQPAYNDPGGSWHVTTYTDGDPGTINADYNCTNVTTSEDADGNTTITAQVAD
jgi:hypothetical protein